MAFYTRTEPFFMLSQETGSAQQIQLESETAALWWFKKSTWPIDLNSATEGPNVNSISLMDSNVAESKL